MCTGKGYVERELLSLRLREKGVLIQGLLCSPLKSGGFDGTFVYTGKGYVEGELLSLRSSESGYLFSTTPAAATLKRPLFSPAITQRCRH